MSNKNSYYNHNTLGRTALDDVLTTVKFNSVFPTYKEWADNLTAYDIKIISETEFNLILGMIGNAYLKFTTPNKNKAYIAFKFEELYAIRLREESLYTKDLNSMLTDKSKNTQKFFTVNRSDITGDIEDKFLNNSATSELESTSKPIDYLELLKNWQLMKLPKQNFLTRLANIIVLPYQPKESYDFEY